MGHKSRNEQFASKSEQKRIEMQRKKPRDPKPYKKPKHKYYYNDEEL